MELVGAEGAAPGAPLAVVAAGLSVGGVGGVGVGVGVRVRVRCGGDVPGMVLAGVVVVGVAALVVMVVVAAIP